MASLAASARLHQTVIGLAALALAVALGVGAAGIPAAAGYAGVGPNFLPWVVAVVLAGCGLWLTVDARRPEGWREMEAPSGGERGDWPALAWVCAGIVANAALITRVGFILACTLCFMLAVRGLRHAEGKVHGGGRGIAIDFATGLLIAAPAYWLFTKLLGINLPGLTGSGWL